MHIILNLKIYLQFFSSVCQFFVQVEDQKSLRERRNILSEDRRRTLTQSTEVIIIFEEIHL